MYTNDDVVGVEFCGAAKNPIAIAVGMSDGLGFGDNTRASLITRSLAEMARLGMLLGAHIATFAGLAGIGDLIATCTSRHSRNRLAGELLAKGASPAEVEQEVGQVVEGIPTAYALHDLAGRLGIEMPVTENVYQVLEGLRTPQECGRRPDGPAPAQGAARRLTPARGCAPEAPTHGGALRASAASGRLPRSVRPCGARRSAAPHPAHASQTLASTRARALTVPGAHLQEARWARGTTCSRRSR